MDQGVKLITAASKAYELAKKQNLSHDKVLSQISRIASGERDEKVKIGMLAAASKTLTIITQNPHFNEKQVLNKVMQDLPDILATANEEVKFNSVD